MKAVVLPVLESWRQIDPPRATYAVDEQLVLEVSAVQAVPEDPADWIRGEIERRTGVRTSDLVRVKTVTGWPMAIADVTHGDQRTMIAMWQFLELAAIATLTGAATMVAKHEDAVKLVLMQATVHWGEPPPTIAALLSGIAAPKAP
jgi:hypothetical protein